MLIGEIREMHLGLLSIKSNDLNLLDVKVSKIKTISSASDTLRIETSDKVVRYGALKPSARPGYVYIVTKEHRHLVQVNTINTLLSFDRHFWENLSGNVSAGFSYSRSSDIGQLNLSFAVYYGAKKYDVGLTGSGIASIDSASFSRDREDLDITLLYNVKNMWYALGSLDYQRNLQLSISRRFQETMAAGYKVMFTRSLQMMNMAGLSVSQERSTTGNNESFLWELPVGFTLDYFKYSHPNIQVSSNNIFYTGLTQWGRVRFNSNNTFSWELFKDFYFTVNLYLNYDNRPPDSGTSTSTTDYGAVVGISYKF